MDPAEKKKLLEYSAKAKPQPFTSWAVFEEKPVLTDLGQPVFDADGAPKTKKVEKPSWTTPETLNWLRRYGRELSQNACRDGWHMRLLDYVAHRHRLPSPDEIETLVLEQGRIDQAKLPQSVLNTRAALKAELLKPLELRAAG